MQKMAELTEFMAHCQWCQSNAVLAFALALGVLGLWLIFHND